MSDSSHQDPLPLWKQRFYAPSVEDVLIASENPSRGIVTTSRNARTVTPQAWDIPAGTLRPLTALEGVGRAWFDAQGRFVVYHDDEHGNELGHLVRVPFEGGEPQDLTPDLPIYAFRGIGFSRDGSAMAFTAVTKAGCHLYFLPLENGAGEPKLLFTSTPHEAFGGLLSQDGKYASLISTARAKGQRKRSLMIFDTASGEMVAELWDGPQADLLAFDFAPEATPWVLAVSNRSGFYRPLLWNPLTQERRDLELPSLQGEVLGLSFSPDGKRILLCQTYQATQQLWVCDRDGGNLTRIAHPSGAVLLDAVPLFPGDRRGEPYFLGNDAVVVPWQNSAHLTQIDLFSAKTGEYDKTLLPAATTPPSTTLKSVTFRSQDGTAIQGWLGVPEGQGPFPVVIEVHGGPEMVELDEFNPRTQAFIDHGFAYLTLNFRGSITFGRDFKEAIWGRLGELELQDMVAARAWLVEQGIARPDAVFLHGYSYGGFLTYYALGRTPEFWAGGIPVMGVADWIANFEDERCTEALRMVFAGRFKGTIAEVRERYIESSPITYVHQVQAPMLIIHGLHDSRVPTRQIELYAQRLKELGKPHELVWYDGGHFPTGAELWIELYQKMLDFLQRTLEGQVRYP